MSVEASVERFIREELLLEIERTRIDPDHALIDSRLLDSLALMRLIVFLEEEFRIRVDDGEVIPDNFQTINLIKGYVQNKQRESGTDRT